MSAQVQRSALGRKTCGEDGMFNKVILIQKLGRLVGSIILLTVLSGVLVALRT